MPKRFIVCLPLSNVACSFDHRQLDMVVPYSHIYTFDFFCVCSFDHRYDCPYSHIHSLISSAME